MAEKKQPVCPLCEQNPIPDADYPSAKTARVLQVCLSCYKHMGADQRRARRHKLELPIRKGGRPAKTPTPKPKPRSRDEKSLFTAIDDICRALESLASGVDRIADTVQLSADNAEEILGRLHGGLKEFESRRKEVGERMKSAEERLRQAAGKLLECIPSELPPELRYEEKEE